MDVCVKGCRGDGLLNEIGSLKSTSIIRDPALAMQPIVKLEFVNCVIREIRSTHNERCRKVIALMDCVMYLRYVGSMSV